MPKKVENGRKKSRKRVEKRWIKTDKNSKKTSKEWKTRTHVPFLQDFYFYQIFQNFLAFYVIHFVQYIVLYYF